MTPARAARAILVPLVLAGALGALGGWLWWRWWGPPPDGKIFETPAGPTWFPDPFDPGVTRDFSGTATYVVVGLALALVLGAVVGWTMRNRAVAGLVAVGLASVAAAAVMTLVGLAQSPPDPQERADEASIGTELPGHLEVSGWSPHLVWPVGALLGLLTVVLSLPGESVTGRSARPGQPSAVPAPQD